MIQTRSSIPYYLSKTSLCLLAVLLFLFGEAKAQQYQLTSPNGRVKAEISNKDNLSFSILKDGQVIVPEVKVNMTLEDEKIPGLKNKIKRTERKKVSQTITPPIAIKNSKIEATYHQLEIKFQEKFSLLFRAYNDAVAYRFILDFPDSITIKNESADISFLKNTQAWAAFNDRWMNSYQNLYKKTSIKQVDKKRTIQLPLLVDIGEEGKLLFTESDLYDYPGLYFTGTKSNTLQSIFPPKVKTAKLKSGKVRPETTFDYIAKTVGHRKFPWRIFALADKDLQLLNNEIVYKLAAPNKLKKNRLDPTGAGKLGLVESSQYHRSRF